MEGELPTIAEESPSAPSRIIRGGAIYFALVFAAGMALGPVRVLYLEPLLGETIAVLCETPFLLLAMAFAAHAAPRWARVNAGWPGYFALGVVALALQLAADLAVGLGLRSMTLAAQLTYFATPAGWIYVLALAAFALMPLLAWFRRSA